MKAQILDAAGQGAEAEKVLTQGMALSISCPQLARRPFCCCATAVKNKFSLSSKAAGNDPDLLLTQAIVLALVDRDDDAGKVLRD